MNTQLTEAINQVTTGAKNCDDASVELMNAGIEITDEIWNALQDAENNYRKATRGLQVGDTINIIGKNGNQDFSGNFRGWTPDGMMVVVYGGGKQMILSMNDTKK
jgi:hypothetical protein